MAAQLVSQEVGNGTVLIMGLLAAQPVSPSAVG